MNRRERGSASLEFLGILPLLALAILAALQLSFSYAAANSTSAAARAAARAVSQGSSPYPAAAAAVPRWMQDDITVVAPSSTQSRLTVRTQGPKILPLLPDYVITRAAWFPRTDRSS